MEVSVTLAQFLGLKMAALSISTDVNGLEAMDALGEVLDQAGQQPAQVAGVTFKGDAYSLAATVDWTQPVSFDITNKQVAILADGFGAIKWRAEALLPQVRKALIEVNKLLPQWRVKAEKQAMFDALTPEQRQALAEMASAPDSETEAVSMLEAQDSDAATVKSVKPPKRGAAK